MILDDKVLKIMIADHFVRKTIDLDQYRFIDESSMIIDDFPQKFKTHMPNFPVSIFHSNRIRFLRFEIYETSEEA